MIRNRRWRWQQSTLGGLVAEFLGTFIIIAFGDGVVAMMVSALTPLVGAVVGALIYDFGMLVAMPAAR